MKRMISFLTGGAIAVAGLASRAYAELSVGDLAPSVEMVGSDGKSYNPADFKDKQAVIIAWFPKAFTGG